MKQMSKRFYLESYIVATVLFFFLVIVIIAMPMYMHEQQVDSNAVLVLFIILLIAVVVYIFVVMAMMLYKMWGAIKDEGTPISPVLAVVLLLIPIVNFFWTVAVYPLYLKYYNEYIGRRAIEVKVLKPGLFYAYPALLIVGILYPFIAAISMLSVLVELFVVIVLPLASFVVFLILVAKTCNAVNALPQPTGG